MALGERRQSSDSASIDSGPPGLSGGGIGKAIHTNDNAVIEPGLRGFEVEEEERNAGGDGQGEDEQACRALNRQPLHARQHATCDVRKEPHKEDHLHANGCASAAGG